MIAASRMQLAAGACFSSAVLGIAYLASLFRGEGQGLPNALALVSLVLFVFILLSLREALLRRLEYELPGWLVGGLIGGHAGLVISSVLDEGSAASARRRSPGASTVAG